MKGADSAKGVKIKCMKGKNKMREEEIKYYGEGERRIKGTSAKEENKKGKREINCADRAKGENKMHEGENKL